MSTGQGQDPGSPLEAIQPDASRRLLIAAVDSFAVRGYHATTTRDISTGAGLSPAAVYVHYRSKADVLQEICLVGHDAVLTHVREAVGRADGPVDQMRAFVSAFAGWHAVNNTLARVIQYEMGALPDEGVAEIARLRGAFDRMVDTMLRGGAEAGAFQVDDLPGTRLAILSLCIDVARWFRPNGRRTPRSVGALYAQLVLNMLGADSEID